MKRGFTLTEILIAVAIIGVIVAIALPIGRSLKRSAHQAACLQKLRSLGVAVENYTIDHGGRYPMLAMGRESRKSEEDEPVLESELFEYAGVPKLLFNALLIMSTMRRLVRVTSGIIKLVVSLRQTSLFLE